MSEKLIIPLYSKEIDIQGLNMRMQDENQSLIYELSSNDKLTDDLSIGMIVEYEKTDIHEADSILCRLNGEIYLRKIYSNRQFIRLEPINAIFKTIIFEKKSSQFVVLGKCKRLIRTLSEIHL